MQAFLFLPFAIALPLSAMAATEMARPLMAVSAPAAAESAEAPLGQGVVPPDKGVAPLAKAMAPARKPLGQMSLDELFATLAAPGDEARSRAAEAEIQRRWAHSGSPTIDLLMGWAQQSLAAKDYGRALDFLDQVVMLKPDYAEGWNRRATIYYLADDYGKALSDLEKVLALQPRHFGALAGIGMIFRDIDRKADSLDAFERALALDPYLDSEIKDTIKTLGQDVRGKEI